MTDKVEIQGKTVDEAVSEALLRMGARRDEVDVTVLEEPKNGLFGFLGGRPARVIVRRRAGGAARKGRAGDFRVDSADHPAHALGSGDGKGGLRRRGGRGRGGEREDREGSRGGRGRGEGRTGAEGEKRAEARGETRGEGRGDRRGRRDDSRRDDSRREDGRRDENRREDGRRGGRPPRQAPDREQARPAAAAPRADDGENDQRDASRRRRGRRGGRGRSGGTREGRPAPQADNNAVHLDLEQDRSLQAIAAEQAEFHARIQAAEQQAEPVEAGDDTRAIGADGGETRSRSRRGGRSRGGRGRRRDEEGGDDRRNGREAERGGERPDERGDRRPAAPAAATAAEPMVPAAAGADAAGDGNRAPAATVADQAIATGVKSTAYAQPKRGVAEDALDTALTELASGMLVRAGFPCRCEVKPGEYRMVRIVTDDISAGMLIGRQGQTIDAVEHLVERMASAAAGDRVRMNLDINNYRRRREDSLLGRVDQAVAELRATGQEVHLEPMEARERRIVHVEAANHKGLCTWTVSGPGGKHVVIGFDDGTPRHQDDDPVEIAQGDEGDDAYDGDAVGTAGAEAADTAAAADLPAADDAVEEPERPGADA